ncbi:MAG: LD-carboxypeptidase [Clostridiales bacterium]|nr:LD-carboxypeptidase [Clostridiales bacterium]
MRYAKSLPKKGTIGFIAPAFGCNIEPYKSAFENAKKVWSQKGYKLKCGPNVYEGCGVGISNTPEKCAEEFNQWYQETYADILISCGGGELMCEILDDIDFEGIKQAEPKWFMGYSDNTNITFLLATLCDTASIYGPCAAAFGMEPWHKSLQDAYRILTGEQNTVHGYDLWEKESLKTEENPLCPYNVTEKKILKRYPDEDIEIEGRLIGGCLDSLANLCGTRYDKVKEFDERYKEDGLIWFMEACDLNVMSIRRALWQLSHAGWFQHVKGFLIGRPYHYGEELLGLDQYQAVLDVLSSYDVPIIMDADIGHLAPMMPLVCGSFGHVTVKGNDISLRMEYRK